MTEVAGTEGFTATRITEVISRAAVSRKAFYEHFDDKEQCFVAAYEQAITPFFTLALRAAESQDAYADRVRAAMAALLSALASDPVSARVAFVEVLAAGPAAVARRNQAMRDFVQAFRDALPDRGRDISEVTMLSLLGGITEVIYQTVSAGQTETLPDLLPELMYSAVLPVVGAAAAEREISRRRSGDPIDPR